VAPTTTHRYHVFETAHGYCAIAWNDVGVSCFQLPARVAETTERNLLRRVPGAKSTPPTALIDDIIDAVQRYFRGETIDFSALTLDLADKDEFFQRIYAALRRVGWGETTTYGTLAKAVGAGSEAARDVGQAMAKNPIPLIIPCHRVLAAGGKVGGFSAPGGTTAKVHMLELEGVRLAPPEPAQQSLGF
jgi:methylated-DNA-[protein]-cysteine S-methyltransferase